MAEEVTRHLSNSGPTVYAIAVLDGVTAAAFCRLCRRGA
jgi:hypothetical protein